MHFCIFEDASVAHFYPLTYFRPVYDLRCGATTMREKIQRFVPARKLVFHVRPHVAPYYQESHPAHRVNSLPADDLCLINGRVLADESLGKLLSTPPAVDTVYRAGEDIAVVFLRQATAARLFRDGFPEVLGGDHFKGLPETRTILHLVNYPWDLIHRNAETIEKDYQVLRKATRPGKAGGKVYPGAILLNKKGIVAGKGSQIKPGAVIDAEKGPVIIGEDAVIMPNTFIEGPASIGRNTLIKVGAKIYHGSSFGEWCKVGGEIEASIIQSYSNKQHDGYLGHAYLGSWVNLGADTNNSDLKNTYGTITVTVNGIPVDTGLQFMGLIMGDHSKTGINVMLDTGTNIGVCCNVYGAGLPPKYLPSFLWGSGAAFTNYDLEKSLETAKRVMGRRSVQLSANYEAMYRCVFDLTSAERRQALQRPQ